LALLIGVAIGVALNAAIRDPDVRATTRTVTVTVTPDVETPTGPTVATGPTGPTATGTTGETGGESTLADPFPVGDSAGAYGWRIKVVAFNPDANDVVQQANSFNRPARRGTYVVATVRFSRTEGGSSDPWFDMEASLVVGGQTYAESDEACCLPDAWDSIGNVPVGGSAVGRIPFDVPRAGLDDAVLYLIITDPEGFDQAEGFFAVT
jgi:hypothetical protein